jgi:hypothetical protein
VLRELDPGAPFAGSMFSRESNAGIFINIGEAPFFLGRQVAYGYLFPLGEFSGRFEYSNPFVLPIRCFFTA